MRKSKFYFITFEGIEGSGKSYQSRKLYKNIQKKNKPVLLTREPGGSISSEQIRKVILTGSKNKFSYPHELIEKFNRYLDLEGINV